MNTPHLVWNEPDGSHHSFDISTPETLIGRRPDSDIIVGHHRVSRHDAKVVASSGRYEVVDLDNAYGTFVSGQKVDRCPLHGGDKLRLAEDAIEIEFITGNA